VSKQTSGSQDEGEWARQRKLQHEALLYLKEHGPTNWDTLCSLFDKKKTGEIEPALRHLARWQHITVEGDIVKITASGTARLNAGLPRPT
jgi:hypothetical protein